MIADAPRLRQRSVSISELAELSGVSPWTIRRRIADGTIQAVRFGRLIRIPLDQPFGTPINEH